MNQDIIKFEYNGTDIEFSQSNHSLMVNATEMAKVFGKRVDVFMKSDHAKAFINVLLSTPYGVDKKYLTDDQIVNANKKGGTWMHRLLALKFAAWLSPEFEVWVYSTIDQILFSYYHDLEANLNETARVDAEIEKHNNDLMEMDTYRKLNSLKKQKTQLVAQRSALSKTQLNMMKELYK